MAVVNIDVRNKIAEAIINLKTVKHTKPTAKKIFSYLRKSDEELELLVLQSYLEKFTNESEQRQPNFYHCKKSPHLRI